MAAVLRLIRETDTAARPRLSWRGDLVTVALGLEFLIGVLVDGWAHFHFRFFDTFFTPWHGLLYAGYVMSGGWLLWNMARFQRLGWVGLAALPRGYELSFAGLLLFGASGIADMVWHVAFGVETDLAAALSPTHLGLYTGAALLLSGPLCAAWQSDEPEPHRAGLVAFVPPLLSLAGSMTAVAYMHAYLWAFNQTWPLRHQAVAYAPASAEVTDLLRAVGDGRGVASILITNVILVTPILVLLLRWRPPFGSVALVWTVVTLLMTIQPGLGLGTILTAARAVATGLLVDGLIVVLDPRPSRPTGFRVFAALAPLIIWSLYFLGAQLHWGLAWGPNLWLGAIVLASVGGVGVSLLIVPPRLPITSR